MQVYETYPSYGVDAEAQLSVGDLTGIPSLPIYAAYARDDRIRKQHVEGWHRFTSSKTFKLAQLDGSHNFLPGESASGMQTTAKQQFFQLILSAVDLHLL